MISRTLANHTRSLSMLYRMQLASQRTSFMAPTVRYIHARGYTNPEDFPTTNFNECAMALMAAKNTSNIIFVCKKYELIMTDKQIMYAFHFIAQNRLDKSPEFWNFLVPLVKKQLRGLDK